MSFDSAGFSLVGSTYDPTFFTTPKEVERAAPVNQAALPITGAAMLFVVPRTVAVVLYAVPVTRDKIPPCDWLLFWLGSHDIESDDIDAFVSSISGSSWEIKKYTWCYRFLNRSNLIRYP